MSDNAEDEWDEKIKDDAKNGKFDWHRCPKCGAVIFKFQAFCDVCHEATTDTEQRQSSIEMKA